MARQWQSCLSFRCQDRRFLADRQVDAERGATADSAGDLNMAAVQLGHGLHYRQPETGARQAGLAGVGGADEPAEELAELLSGDADPLVGDVDPPDRAIAAGPDQDLAILAGELD